MTHETLQPFLGDPFLKEFFKGVEPPPIIQIRKVLMENLSKDVEDERMRRILLNTYYAPYNGMGMRPWGFLDWEVFL